MPRKTKVGDLSPDQRFQVLRELERLLPDLKERKANHHQAAMILTKRLGFQVTERNVGEICKATGIMLERQRSTYISRLYNRTQELASRLDTLERTIRDLYGKLGEACPLRDDPLLCELHLNGTHQEDGQKPEE